MCRSHGLENCCERSLWSFLKGRRHFEVFLPGQRISHSHSYEVVLWWSNSPTTVDIFSPWLSAYTSQPWQCILFIYLFIIILLLSFQRSTVKLTGMGVCDTKRELTIITVILSYIILFKGFWREMRQTPQSAGKVCV